jgi:hypothetical protein
VSGLQLMFLMKLCYCPPPCGSGCFHMCAGIAGNSQFTASFVSGLQHRFHGDNVSQTPPPPPPCPSAVPVLQALWVTASLRRVLCQVCF